MSLRVSATLSCLDNDVDGFCCNIFKSFQCGLRCTVLCTINVCAYMARSVKCTAVLHVCVTRTVHYDYVLQS